MRTAFGLHFPTLVLLSAAASLAAPAPPRAALARDQRLFESRWVGFDSSNYNTARYLYASTVADLDLDGDPDVATASWPNIPRVTVLRNRGDGMFEPPDAYALPTGSYEVIAADFTGDGFPDLVASNTDPNFFGTSVSLFRNLGDATFAPRVTFPSGSGPVGLAAADFDDDGDRDLAVANWGFFGAGSTVSILENDGNGSFAPPVAYAAGASPYRVIAEDLNGDGAIDLAASNGRVSQSGTAQINLLLNDGSGTFASRRTLSGFFAGNSFFPTVVAADMDLDSDPDLLYSDAGTDGVFLFTNQGSGQFEQPQFLPAPSFSGGPNSLQAADVTGDGWPDLAGTLQSNQGWTLYPSTGGGAFGTAVRYSAGEAPYDTEIADADGDGDLDPFIACRDSLEIAVQFNPGDGDFSPPPTHPVTIFSEFFDHGDIDEDGDLDIASASGSAIELLRNPGNGSFAPKVTLATPSASTLDVKLRDLDADGHLDLVWSENDPPYRWGSAFGDGNGGFANARIWPVPTCGYFKAEIDAFDFDGDADLDVIQIENLGCVNISLSARRVFVNQNVGGRSFQLFSILVINPNPRSLAGGDFNHDGNLDLAITSQPTTILLGHGDLTFTQLDAGNVPGINIATADFDRDGVLDLALALQRNVAPFIESMAIQLGNGDGTFAPPVIYLGSHAPNLAQISEIQSGDVDQDGDADVLALNYASNDVSVWRNDGSGAFAPQVRYGAGMGALDMSYADFTGDGIRDLATYSGSFPPLSQSIQVFAGRDLDRGPHAKKTGKTPKPVSR